jgi:hypothetical protein
VRHGLLAIHVLAGTYSVHDDLFVPVVGNCNDDGVNLFVVEQLLIAPRRPYGFPDNFTRQFVTAIVKIASGYALDSGELNGSCKESGALHANAYNSKTNSVTGGSQSRQSDEGCRFQ